MKKTLLLTLLLSTTVFAQLNVETTYSYLGEITKRVGGNLVNVGVLASPKLDPHFIVPKPSLISKLRKSDLLIINGGQLEIGWLPPLLRAAQNSKINPGRIGFLDVSAIITMLDKPAVVSRSLGDIHPDGNPHFALDVNNVIPIAQLISMKLSQVDAKNSTKYKENFLKFKKEFSLFEENLAKEMSECENKNIAQYHQLFNYALRNYGVTSIGTIEPLPGITPSSKHTVKLINAMKEDNIKIILQDAYHEKRTAKFIASKTDAEVRVVPHDVGAVKNTDTLESFYTMVAHKICK